MSWQGILKSKPLLEKVDSKQKKKLKKLLQSSQPTEFFGQDMTKLSGVIEGLMDLDLVQKDEAFKKKMKKYEEKNLDILSSAAELRKDYETLYGQLRQEILPKKKSKVGKKK